MMKVIYAKNIVPQNPPGNTKVFAFGCKRSATKNDSYHYMGLRFVFTFEFIKLREESLRLKYKNRPTY